MGLLLGWSEVVAVLLPQTASCCTRGDGEILPRKSRAQREVPTDERIGIQEATVGCFATPFRAQRGKPTSEGFADPTLAIQTLARFRSDSV